MKNSPRPSRLAGERNLSLIAQALRGDFEFEWPFQELTGYQFVMDSLRSAVAGLLVRLGWCQDAFVGSHVLISLVLALISSSSLSLLKTLQTAAFLALLILGFTAIP